MSGEERIGPYLPGPNETEENGIYIGDARELAELIPDESFDLVFTDPVYDRFEDYEWLGRTASRVLRDDRAALVWYGIGYLDKTLEALKQGGLNYRWNNIVYLTNQQKISHADMGYSKYQGLFWMEKGRMKGRRSRDLIPSLYRTSSTAYRKYWRWSKNRDAVREWLTVFTKKNHIVFDPFAGRGSMPIVCKLIGLKYVAFEVDEERVIIARQAVREAETPLPIKYADQLELLEEGLA